jgi:hypothetical protein
VTSAVPRFAPSAGAAIGVVLAGGLVAVAGRIDGSVWDAVFLPLTVVVYPLSALVGSDLVAPGAKGESPMLRVAGYVAALAAATGFMVAGFGTCNTLGAGLDSALWGVAYATCSIGAPLGRAVARGLAERMDMRHWAILVWSSLLVLMGWVGVLMTIMSAVFRLDTST